MKELVALVSSLDSQREVVKTFWWSALDELERHGIQCSCPDLHDKPLFHVRWTSRNNHSCCYIELLRLDSAKWGPLLRNALEDALLSSHASVTGYCWRDCVFKQSTEFLTFLQACTVLRVRRDIVHPCNLAGWEGPTYDQCPKCREAYEEMRKPNQPWSDILSPWFRYLDQLSVVQPTNTDNRYEYGHWFGHIVSNRFE